LKNLGFSIFSAVSVVRNEEIPKSIPTTSWFVEIVGSLSIEQIIEAYHFPVEDFLIVMVLILPFIGLSILILTFPIFYKVRIDPTNLNPF